MCYQVGKRLGDLVRADEEKLCWMGSKKKV